MTPREPRLEGWQGRPRAALQQRGLLGDGAHSLGGLVLRNSFEL